MIILNENPFVSIIDELGIDESVYIDMLTTSNFERSLGYNGKGESSPTNIRTSSTAHTGDKYKSTNHHILNILEKRFGHKYDVENSEACQLTRYEVDQEYRGHWDYFNHKGCAIDQENDRKATVILYLNDNFEGGETRFDKLNITVKPKKGTALYFTYENEDTKDLSFHAGLPVKFGTKNIATFWLR
jgi:prolyl 4-hydroxylase